MMIESTHKALLKDLLPVLEAHDATVDDAAMTLHWIRHLSFDDIRSLTEGDLT